MILRVRHLRCDANRRVSRYPSPVPRRQPSSTGADNRRTLDRLRALSLEPERQKEFARELIATIPDSFVLDAALKALGDNIGPEERVALVGRYAVLEADGPRRDPGGHARATIISAMRRVALPSDAALFERAATTEEFSFQGGTPALQAAGLLALGELEPERASFVAAVLLTKRSKALSPEPALSAARLLAAGDEALALLVFVSMDMAMEERGVHVSERPLAEVISEAIRGLRTLPAEFLSPVLDRYAAHPDDVVLLGVCDLVIEHEPHPTLAEFTGRFLRASERYDVYHYFATAVVASHRPDLIALLVDAAPLETDRLKLKSLLDALELIGGDPDIDVAVALLREKLASTPRDHKGGADQSRPARGRYDRRTEVAEDDSEDADLE